jgi:heme-degrading monooxygenase HmoA
MGMFRVKAGQLEQLRATYNERAVPKVRSHRGCLGCLLLEPAAPRDDPFIACTIWASRADGDAYESSGSAQEVVGYLRDHFAGPPILKSYESHSALALEPPPTKC